MASGKAVSVVIYYMRIYENHAGLTCVRYATKLIALNFLLLDECQHEVGQLVHQLGMGDDDAQVKVYWTDFA